MALNGYINAVEVNGVEVNGPQGAKIIYYCDLLGTVNGHYLNSLEVNGPEQPCPSNIDGMKVYTTD